ncbi:hypothetical protein X798_06680 [Onchocerca flexuosa]|uniref:Uncharacterized protein n=1 Tax=Onchocerca flexuosa TaxID=387005 RepID=A0A238BNU4_9BILA|nr:hypothetical protein X798_06680 [Onchocerca flexuosa]
MIVLSPARFKLRKEIRSNISMVLTLNHFGCSNVFRKYDSFRICWEHFCWKMIIETIEVGRCLCIHAQLQAVDTILQSLLYQRGVVPSVVTQLLSTIESHHEIKFVETYTKVCFFVLHERKKERFYKIHCYFLLKL